MEYQEEDIIEGIEDQLILVNTSLIEQSVDYEELMALPRMLKRNYFK